MNDPTIQSPCGPPEDATGDWRVSLAEIDAMGRKAARGAGFAWGMAEEAGRAARWLAAYGLPGPEALVMALTAIDGNVARHAPRIDGTSWRCAAEGLCPIATGAALSDRAEGIAHGRDHTLEPVLRPLLMVPFLCRAARDLDCAILMEGPGVRLIANAAGPAAADWDAWDVTQSGGLLVRRTAEPLHEPRRAGSAGRAMPVTLWRRLDRFAQRTYAPATEASRRAGAGPA